jgi:hypothetical protein
MEAKSSSETSDAFQRITRRYIPEGVTLHNDRYENLKSYLLKKASTLNSCDEVTTNFHYTIQT